MREPQQQTSQLDDEATLVVGEERTLVAPRFDDEETLVARPVVPLENGAHIDAPAPLPVLPARGYNSPFATRRPRSLALMLVSVLIGGVLGGAGLYLYQRQSQDLAVSPAATTTAAEQPATPDAEAQAPAAPAEVPQAAPNAEAQARQTEPPPDAATNVAEPAAHAPVEEVPAAARARAPESVPAAERRTTAPSEGTPRRGKKGERDEEVERRAPARPEGNDARDDQPEARQVDTIFYRQRRAERRAERRARRARRADDADRLRRIFEGPPE